MEINYRVAFHKDEVPALLYYLKQHQIQYNQVDTLIAFDMLESNPHWSFIEECVVSQSLFAWPSKVFSKKELLEAEWFVLWSRWHFDYPQPEDSYWDEITYTQKDACKLCQNGEKQIAPFRMKKVPKWGRRGFLMMNWISDEFFVSEETKQLMEQEEFSDISFCEVQNKSGKETIPGVYQLMIHRYLPGNAIKDNSYSPGFFICPGCGRKIYKPDLKEKVAYHKEAFASMPDIVKTTDYMGHEDSGSHQRILVNQKFYRTITKHHLDRSLEFEPIDLV